MKLSLFKTCLQGVVFMLFVCATNKATATEVGVFTGHGCPGIAPMAQFTTWFGAKPTHNIQFTDISSWDNMMKNAVISMDCWKDQGYNMTWTVGMLPADGSATLEEGARGTYNHYFYTLGTELVQRGFSNAILRVGHEFNSSGYPWAASKNPTAWVAYYRQIVTTLRSVPGANFQFDWCSNPGTRWIAQDKVYPGDDYVDIIGMDVYNEVWDVNAPHTSEAQWNFLVTQPNGLNWLASFAQRHHKRISIPEWATGRLYSAAGAQSLSVGDDSLFITNMAAWMKANNVLYFDYWDVDRGGYNGRLETGEFPKTAAAFRANFRP
jgi:hypothetical protein